MLSSLAHRTARITLNPRPSRRRQRSPSGWDHNLSRLATLADPTRRDLYHYVASQPGPVSREQAARALGISRPLAAFHLDKLLAAGLLQAEFRRLTGRQGPGAGRPAKLYRRSPAELTVSLPARRYELAANLLAQAIQRARARKASPLKAADEAARAFGLALGKSAREQAGPRAGRARLLARAEDVLRAHGFEPLHEPKGWIRLRNCPFDTVAREHRQLICGMNLALMKGLMRGLGLGERSALLKPQPDGCCVILRAAGAR